MSALLTAPEVAKCLRISRWTVYDLVRDGRLRAVRLTPGKLLFTQKDVDKAIRRAADRRHP
jgi:excisionase family DNA binding protein